MEKVEISVSFEDFKILKIGDTLITDFETAINIVRASKIRNVRLRQNSRGSVMEWNNF